MKMEFYDFIFLKMELSTTTKKEEIKQETLFQYYVASAPLKK